MKEKKKLSRVFPFVCKSGAYRMYFFFLKLRGAAVVCAFW